MVGIVSKQLGESWREMDRLGSSVYIFLFFFVAKKEAMKISYHIPLFAQSAQIPCIGVTCGFIVAAGVGVGGRVRDDRGERTDCSGRGSATRLLCACWNC